MSNPWVQTTQCTSSTGANGRMYQYGPTEEGKPYRLETETGWIRMGITQDVSGDTNAKAPAPIWTT